MENFWLTIIFHGKKVFIIIKQGTVIFLLFIGGHKRLVRLLLESKFKGGSKFTAADKL